MTTLAETILRDVKRYSLNMLAIEMSKTPHGAWVKLPAVEAALTAAMDPALSERAGALTRRLRKTEEAGHVHHLSKSDRFASADLITDLLVQNAALRAERDRYLRHLTAGAESLNAYKARAEAAEATIATLTEKVEAMRRALKYYKDTFCEGFCGEDCWSDEGHSHPDLQRDCSGCLAASVLIRAARTTEASQ